MKRLVEKYPVIRYMLLSYIISFGAFGVFMAVLIGILNLTGLYSSLETALDIKYNSVYVNGPIWLFLALALGAFLVACLMYFHKYRRTKHRTVFSRAFSELMQRHSLENTTEADR